MTSPGASSVPAKSEPIITVFAPGGDRLDDVAGVLDAAVGDDRDVGRRRAPCAQSLIAVICGTPTPATTRVVQIDPGPMPTLTASTPASISARAPSAVATLPAMS